MPAEQMFEHVRDTVFPFLRKLNSEENSVYNRYMKILLSQYLLHLFTC